MNKANEESIGIPPSVMTVEMFTPGGKRYNFEQVFIDIGTDITFTNESGNEIILKFWKYRQPDKDYPCDKESVQHYVNETLQQFKEKNKQNNGVNHV